MSDRRYKVVVTTCDAPEKAERIARTLVEERLAACVNILDPVRSVYRWEGAIEETAEWMLWIKTREDRLTALAARLREIHDYDVPERIVLSIEDGDPAYLAWLDRSIDETDS